MFFSNYSKRIELSEIEPYRKGGYSYEFVLHDSLELLLDQNYKIYLETRPYKCLLSSSFMFEEYELIDSKFTLRTPKDTHYKGTPFAIYTKATDQNDMNLLDAYIEILIYNNYDKTAEQFADYTFIPDTIWKYNQKLDVIGETKIIIPDSIMPPASFDYEIVATMKTSDYEVLNEMKIVTYKHSSQEFDYKYTNDSVRFFYKENDIEKIGYPRKVGQFVS